MAETKAKANNDPLNINQRLYNQLGLLLDQLEARDQDDDAPKITLKERIAALIAVGRIQTIFAGLRRKDNRDDPDAGSAARKYSGAFKNAPRGRAKGRGGRTPEPDPVASDWFEHAAADDGGDADDFDA